MSEELWRLKGEVFALHAVITMILRRVAVDRATSDAIISEIRTVMNDMRTAHTPDAPVTPSTAALEQGALQRLESLVSLLVNA